MKPFEHTVVRTVGVPPDAAFAWLTDYREDDARWIFGDEKGRRSFERRDARTIAVNSVAKFAGIRSKLDALVRLAPPHVWRAHGQVRCLGVRVLAVDAQWEVEERSSDGAILTARFRLHPLNVAARAFLTLWGSRIRKAFEDSYDQIAEAVTAAAALPLAPAKSTP
ncbi:MAG TPA: hypothetical protein VGK67_34720 [Myxococcales bacterium]|jgi:hypothetical protein